VAEDAVLYTAMSIARHLKEFAVILPMRTVKDGWHGRNTL
jgi:hypothetical protein